jgi:hypothetical protein
MEKITATFLDAHQDHRHFNVSFYQIYDLMKKIHSTKEDKDSLQLGQLVLQAALYSKMMSFVGQLVTGALICCSLCYIEYGCQFVSIYLGFTIIVLTVFLLLGPSPLTVDDILTVHLLHKKMS